VVAPGGELPVRSGDLAERSAVPVPVPAREAVRDSTTT